MEWMNLGQEELQWSKALGSLELFRRGVEGGHRTRKVRPLAMSHQHPDRVGSQEEPSGPFQKLSFIWALLTSPRRSNTTDLQPWEHLS